MAIYDDVPLDQKLTVFGAGLADARAIVGATAVNEQDENSPFNRLDLRTTAGDIFIPGLRAVEPLMAEVEDLGRSIEQGREPTSSGRFGLRVVDVLSAITRSIEQDGHVASIELSSP
jgi:predicted dehydrogenase